jgi:hypothetical protein
MIPSAARQVSRWLGRDVSAEPAAVEVRSAVASALAGA